MSAQPPGSAGILPASFQQRITVTRRQNAGAPGLGGAIMLVLFFTMSMAQGATNAVDEAGLPKLAPPYAELPPTFWEQHGTMLVMIALLVLVVAAILVLVAVRPKRAVVVTPEQAARRALTQLVSRPEDGAVLSQVSQILRRYFVAVFALPPGEYTTADFTRTIAAREEIGPELAAGTTDFLRACDERKFSESPQLSLSNATAQALELVNQAETRRARLRQAALDKAGAKPPGKP